MQRSTCRLRTTRSSPARCESRAGFTLIECVVVVALLSVTAAAILLSIGGAPGSAATLATQSSMDAVRDAALGRQDGGGFRADVGAMPRRITDLLAQPAGVPAYDVTTRVGWRGPYLRPGSGAYVVAVAQGFLGVYGADGDPAVLDGWGRPLVLQVPRWDGVGEPAPEDLLYARLVSAGPDGVLQTPRTDAGTSPPGTVQFPSLEQCGDDLVRYIRVSDRRPR